jgi:hypothetical protein
MDKKLISPIIKKKRILHNGVVAKTQTTLYLSMHH